MQPSAMTHTKTDTMLLTKPLIEKWKSPPFQRPLRVNAKVLELVEEIKRSGGVVPGVVTLGFFEGDKYLLDGQHRIHAFQLTGLAEGYADVRTFTADSMAAMADEYVELNSRLVNFRPDDILKGLEASYPALAHLRGKCDFIGYDSIRRGPKAPLLSMSSTLRSWAASAPDAPTAGGHSASAHLATEITMDDVETLESFLRLALAAWGRDAEYYRLWGALNLVLCMWLYRRTVITQYSPASARLTKAEFGKCLMSLSADPAYTDWLMGRSLGERDRSPAYARIKTIFVKRLLEERGALAIRLPSPTWAHGHGPSHVKK